MPPPRTPSRPTPEIVRVPATFHVRDHTLRLSCISEGRWSATVDGAPLDGSYGTEVEAWEAGVREAERLDRVPR